MIFYKGVMVEVTGQAFSITFPKYTVFLWFENPKFWEFCFERAKYQNWHRWTIKIGPVHIIRNGWILDGGPRDN